MPARGASTIPGMPAAAGRGRIHRTGVPGETFHVAGKDGVHDAKEWLERTGTVDAYLDVYDKNLKGYLQVDLADGSQRSFDLGGHYGSARRHFFAEVKNYSGAIAGKAYSDFLATCYCRSLDRDGDLLDFMFITWHPFLVTRWPTLRQAESVIEAVNERTNWVSDGHHIDEKRCGDIASRLWIIVLSKRSQDLQLPVDLASKAYRKLRKLV